MLPPLVADMAIAVPTAQVIVDVQALLRAEIVWTPAVIAVYLRDGCDSEDLLKKTDGDDKAGSLRNLRHICGGQNAAVSCRFLAELWLSTNWSSEWAPCLKAQNLHL